MFERFTDRARCLLVLAQQEATALGHDHIGTEHLLLGLLAEDMGVAGGVLASHGVSHGAVRAAVGQATAAGASTSSDADALRAIGIDLDAVRRRAEEAFGPGALEMAGVGSRRGRRSRPGLSASRPFTPRAKKVLELSLREALQLHHKHIGPEHVLLGLLREGQGLGALVVHQLGADLVALRAGILAALGRAA